MTAGADLRLLRAAVFTAVCVVLSAAGHTAAAGAPVPVWTLGVGFALVLAVTAPLAGGERSLPSIAAALATGQVALHTLFCFGGSMTSSPGATPGAARPGGGLRALAENLVCGHAAAGTLSPARAREVVSRAGLSPDGLAAAAPGAPSAAGDGADTVAEGLRVAAGAALAQLSGPMLLGHLLAALAAGWLLRRGEAALWRLLRISADAARAAEELLGVTLRRALRTVRALLHGDLVRGAPPRRVAATPRVRAARVRTEVLTGGVTRRGPPRAADRFALVA